jgi:hypothetical protein
MIQMLFLSMWSVAIRMDSVAAEQGKQEDRNIAEKRVEAEQKWRVRQLQDEPVLRDLLHPRANGGCARANPEDTEIVILKSLEDASQHGGIRSNVVVTAGAFRA